MWPELVSSGAYLQPQGLPAVSESSPTDLSIAQPLSGGGAFAMTCTESNITCAGANPLGQSLNWAWLMVGGSQQASAVQSAASNSISYTYQGTSYPLKLDSGTCQQLGNGNLKLTPDTTGRIILNLNPGF